MQVVSHVRNCACLWMKPVWVWKLQAEQQELERAGEKLTIVLSDDII